jgi:hypothetical protein
MLCKIWGIHSGDYEECRLLGYENPVLTSQATHYVSATESHRLMLCKIWRFHGADYEGRHILGYKSPVRNSQETHCISTPESSRWTLWKIWGFHGSDYNEFRVLVRWFFHTENGCEIFLRNVGSYKNYTATPPRRRNSPLCSVVYGIPDGGQCPERRCTPSSSFLVDMSSCSWRIWLLRVALHFGGCHWTAIADTLDCTELSNKWRHDVLRSYVWKVGPLYVTVQRKWTTLQRVCPSGSTHQRACSTYCRDLDDCHEVDEFDHRQVSGSREPPMFSILSPERWLHYWL